MKYDKHQIAKELQMTAMGEAYYGNALYVSLDIPELDRYQKKVLRRFLNGTESVADSYELQNIANVLIAS